jgi:RNA binding exosome subunit
MKYIHNITIRAFSKNDTQKSIEKGFDYIIPFDLLKEKIKIKTEYFGADSDNPDAEPITVYSVFFDRQAFIGDFMRYFRNLLSPGQKKNIIEKAEKFMDEECAIYVRIDKDALRSEKLELVEHGNCFHITMNIAAFPKKKEKAMEVVKMLFSE